LEYIKKNLNGGLFKMAVDPVCKMDVNEKEAKLVSEYKGKKYYFCAPGCKKAFENKPEQYVE
jgi:YHS domain-containing protein